MRRPGQARGILAVISFRYAALAVLPALLLLSACGGDDDDSKNGDDSSGSSSSSSSSNGSSGSSKYAIDIPKIKDGNFEKAKAHVEVSGDKDFKVDMDGNGLATNGFALLTFSDGDGSVQVTLNGTEKDSAGGAAVTTKDLATGGGWGQDCSVKVTDSDKELKGEFECKQVEGIQPGGVKTYKVHVKGTFSATR